MTPETQIVSDQEDEFRRIAIHLIRDPQSPARETMNDEKFIELCESIKTVGLIEPVVVKDCNEYFEVIAGHRRTLACRAVQLQLVPCMIRRNTRVSHMAVMIHENAVREDMNVVQEGRFYLQALEEECAGDVDKLCSMLNRNREYVEGRILLLDGYPQVVDALEQGHIGMAVSRLLNKVEDPNRMLLLLDQAMAGGANAKMVAQWVRDENAKEPIILPPDDPEAQAAAIAAAAQSSKRICMLCGSERHAHTMQPIWVHELCLDNFRDAKSHVNQHSNG